MKGVAWGGENASVPLWFTRHVSADEDKMCQNVLLQGDEAHACVTNKQSSALTKHDV